jgi:hypothetical protein
MQIHPAHIENNSDRLSFCVRRVLRELIVRLFMPTYTLEQVFVSIAHEPIMNSDNFRQILSTSVWKVFAAAVAAGSDGESVPTLLRRACDNA